MQLKHGAFDCRGQLFVQAFESTQGFLTEHEQNDFGIQDVDGNHARRHHQREQLKTIDDAEGIRHADEHQP